MKTQKTLMCSEALKFKICLLFLKKKSILQSSVTTWSRGVSISISNHLASSFYTGLLYINMENYWILFNKERSKLSVLINTNKYDTQAQRSKKHKLDITA